MRGFSNFLSTFTFISSQFLVRELSLHAFIYSRIFMYYNLLTLTIYFDAQSTHQLVIGRPLRLATVPSALFEYFPISGIARHFKLFPSISPEIINFAKKSAYLWLV